MNLNQLNGILRAVIPAALAYAAGRGWLTQGQIADVTAAIITLVSAAWSVRTNVK